MNKTFFYKAANLQEEFSWKDIFSEALQPHTKEQRGKLLVRGITGYVPSTSGMLDEWQKPWLFVRFGGIGLFLAVLAVFIWNMFTLQLRGVDFSVYLIVSFVPVLAVVIFFWEINIPGTISIFETIFIMMLGGLLSIFGTGNLHYLISNIPEALLGPLPEEIAKFVMVWILLSRRKYKYGLEGVLLGCAIGAGFGAIETAGYGLATYNDVFTLLQLECVNEGRDLQDNLIYIAEQARQVTTDTLITRGCLAIGGHTLWAAMYGGSLGLAKKGGEKLKADSLINPLVILTWGCAFILHTLWNLDPNQLKGIASEAVILFIVNLTKLNIKYALLIIAGWLLLLIILRKCICQVIAVSQYAVSVPHIVPGTGANLNERAGAEEKFTDSKTEPVHAGKREILTVTSSGEFQRGKKYHLGEGQSLIFGRDAGRADIVFPPDTKGVSSIHCEIRLQSGYPVLIDRNSSFGTFFSNGQRLEPNIPYKLKNQVKFYLGTETYKFTIEMKG